MEVNKTRSSKYLLYALTMLWSGDILNIRVGIMEKKKTLKRFFLILLSLYFVSFVILPLVCLTEEISSTDFNHSSCIDQTNHSSPPIKNKLPCPNNHSCCSFIVSNTSNYFFALNSSMITRPAISFQPLEIAASVFRPPEAKI